MAVIPSTTEFGYEPSEAKRVSLHPTLGIPMGQSAAENRHTKVRRSDWSASMDLLSDLAPSCGAVVLAHDCR